MNIKKMFDTQRALDEAIIQKKGLQDQDLLPQKILALQVELGECANEWRGFKFWSEDNKARTEKHVLKEEFKHLHITRTGEYEFQLRDEFGKVVFDDVTDSHHDIKNPLLEEYIDCLHFILSIGTHHYKGNELPNTNHQIRLPNVTYQFTELFMVEWERADDTCGDYRYGTGLRLFLALGGMLGFSDEEVEAAYYVKNKINHQRQENGY